MATTQSASHATTGPDEFGYLPRSRYLPLAIVPALALTAVGWMAGGHVGTAHAAWIAMTVALAGMFVAELYRFPQRFGVGGLVLFGGCLIWLCYDYLTHWLGRDLSSPVVSVHADTLVRASFAHALFMTAMIAGLLLPVHRRAVRILQLIPEPTTTSFYPLIILGSLIVGLIPYAVATSEPVHMALWHEMTGGRTSGAAWTVGRSGNLNTNWSAYIALLIQIGQVGGQLAVFYALLIARTGRGKLLGWVVFLFWSALAFGSGTRGDLVFMTMPAVALLYLKYQGRAAALLQKISVKAYVVCGVLATLVLFAVQFQAAFRGTSYGNAELGKVKMIDLAGNSMFSESLPGFQRIPRDQDFFYNRYPGEAIVRPIPNTVWDFLIGPIPRALWKSKPVDPVWKWYNEVFTGAGDGTKGTTIAQGLVGAWYFRYGLAGVIEGGLLMGWLLALGERALQQARGRPICILISLGFLTWLFRSFRGLRFHDLYPLIIGAVLLWVLVKAQHMTSGQAAQPPSTDS